MLKRFLAAITATVFICLLSGCDNDTYTEYAGEITTLDSAAVSSLQVSQSVSAAESRREKEEDKLKENERIEKPILIEETRALVADRMGNMVEVPEHTDTIISLAPSITEILVGLGLADNIIAADTNSVDVDGIEAAICTLDMVHPDTQLIAALSPDIVILGDLSGGLETTAQLDNMGIRTAYIPTAKNIEAIKMDIEFIGAITRTSPAAIELISQMNTDLDFITGRLIKPDGDITRHPYIHLEYSPYPDIWVAGGNNFIAAAISCAGGQIYYAGAEAFYQLNDALIFGVYGNSPITPDYIISAVFDEGYDYMEIYSRPGWDALTAVQNEKVFALPTDAILRPSQNITTGILELAKILHPDLFR